MITLPYIPGSYRSGYFARKDVKSELERLATAHKKHLSVHEHISEAEEIMPLGSGGHGRVSLVERKSDRKLYAQKESFETRERLLIELIALLLLEHKTIVNPHEIGELKNASLVLREDYLKNAVPLKRINIRKLEELARFLDLFREVSEGVKHVHDRGIVHGDLKPTNILVNKQGAHITDFGCATIKRPDIDVVIRMRDGFVAGTLTHMAPEFCGAGSKIDFSSDIYSLVVTMYELLTGELPYYGLLQTEEQMVHAVRCQPPADIRDLSPIKNETFAKALLGALAKDPESRTFKSTEEFVQFLKNVTPEKLFKKKALI